MDHFSTPQYLRLELSPGHDVSVDLSKVQEIIHMDRSVCAATWSDSGEPFVRVRSRLIPLLELGGHLGFDTLQSTRRMVLVQVGRKLHAVAAHDSRPESGHSALIDLDTLVLPQRQVRKSA